jgi:hypothetical protein
MGCVGPLPHQGCEVMAAKAHDYRRYAQECLEAASRVHGEEERSILLHIAQTWQRLADQEEVGSRSSAEQAAAQQQQQVHPDVNKKE